MTGKPSLTFREFLAIHYSSTPDSDNDDREDRQLPFSSGESFNHVGPFIIHNTFNIGITEFDVLLDKIGRYNEFFPSPGLIAVFHPPRVPYNNLI